MTGTVVKVFEKKFGFIKGTDGVQYFFHESDLTGFWDDLEMDVNRGKRVDVTFEIGSSTKGPRAAEVSRVDGGTGI